MVETVKGESEASTVKAFDEMTVAVWSKLSRRRGKSRRVHRRQGIHRTLLPADASAKKSLPDPRTSQPRNQTMDTLAGTIQRLLAERLDGGIGTDQRQSVAAFYWPTASTLSAATQICDRPRIPSKG
jgi:hypothetical protein